MRITVICSVFPPTPAAEATHAALLCENLAKYSDHQVTLITSRGVAPDAPHPGYELRANMKGWSWRNAAQLKREIAATRPDAVLLIYLGWLYDERHPMITFLPNYCAKLNPKPKVVIQFENTGHAEPRTFAERTGRKFAEILVGAKSLEWRYGTLLRDSDAIITLCEPHLERLIDVLPEVAKKNTTMPAPPLLKMVDDPNGEVRRSARAEIGAADDDFVVSYFGYLYPQKGVETMIEAAGRALKSVPNLRLLLIGGTLKGGELNSNEYSDKLHAMVRDLGLEHRTFWTGHKEGVDASRFIRGADAMALPFVEGIRLNNSTVAVTTSHNLPLITTRGKTLESAFVDRENVVLSPAGDAEGMAANIVAVAKNENGLRDALLAGSKRYAEGSCSWPAVVRQTVEVLK